MLKELLLKRQEEALKFLGDKCGDRECDHPGPCFHGDHNDFNHFQRQTIREVLEAVKVELDGLRGVEYYSERGFHEMNGGNKKLDKVLFLLSEEIKELQ